MEKVSIILPVYNSEKYIKRALDSLISQTYDNIEVLCVNDGSKDNSLNILQEYALKDNRIKVFSQENSGPAKTRNTGLENSTGEFLMFCDSDDSYEPAMVETMVKAIKENDVDFAMCDSKVIVEDKDNVLRCRGGRNYNTNIIKDEGIIKLDLIKKYKIRVLLWNKIFKMEKVKKYKMSFPNGYEDDDTCFVYQYMYDSDKYYAIKKQLYNYYIRNNSIMDIFFRRIAPEKLYDKVTTLEHLSEFLLRNKKLLTKRNNKLYFLQIVNKFKISFIGDCQTIEEKENSKKILSGIIKRTADKIKYPKFFYKLDNMTVEELEEYLKHNSAESIVFGFRYKVIDIINKIRRTIFILKII